MRAATYGFGRDGRGAVSIVFATAAIPLVMAVGLAIDYSFYVQAQAQLDLAADAGALQAVRVASNDFVAGQTPAQAGSDGAAAGSSWFSAQLGTLGNAAWNPVMPAVAYDASTSTFTSTVGYTATMAPRFGSLFKLATWNMAGSSSAVITTNSFVEIDMLMDNSSSMLIGATPTDIKALQSLTVCPPTATAAATGHGGQQDYNQSDNPPNWTAPYGEYSWNLPVTQDFSDKAGHVTPTLANKAGSCDTNFTGDATECVDPPTLSPLIPAASGGKISGIAQIPDANGYCPTNYGTPDTKNVDAQGKQVTINDSLTGKLRNLPSAPCGFACHSDQTPNDYYNILLNARAKGASITLRFDVIQLAAAQVVQTMVQKQQVPNQFTLGVFTFNSTVDEVHPSSSGSYVPPDSNLTKGLSDIQAIQAPAVADNPNTNFPGAMSYLASNFTQSGDGSSAAAPRKNLFIITDGLEDYSPSSRFIGQMTSPSNETNCAPLKAKGYNIYVLYTPYYPLPNPFYLNNGARAAVEAPLSNTSLSIAAALQACATNPSQYYQATSTTEINNALQTMLASALNSPGRITN